MNEKICRDCPRNCGAPRTPESGSGFCKMGLTPLIARAALHHWEEPCISGKRGSGAVFFSGCALGCVFCQNEPISRGGFGKAVSVFRLQKIYRELIAAGAHNINLVNPTHFTDAVSESLTEPLPVPVVYNCGGYERIETLRRLKGKINIYLPDLKYLNPGLAARCAQAPDYPDMAKAAIREMVRQVGPVRLNEEGMLLSGVLIRHLILPGEVENALDAIDWVQESFPPKTVLLSLMGQYLPCGRAKQMPGLDRPLLEEEQHRVEEYLLCSGFEDGYLQELSSASEEYIPDFHLQGVEHAEK
ncbi:MAG: radical SAM protein [Provencibacterium sp.]|jgi:putative pyruvate formate lyase activating enzyme|nr:radical SAM protein [Provencibacterium sp.]